MSRKQFRKRCESSSSENETDETDNSKQTIVNIKYNMSYFLYIVI